MKWILIIVMAIAVVFYFLTKSGNHKFWKLVNKYPLQAYDFFINNDCWLVIHPGDNVSKPSTGDWTGPFFVVIQGIGRLKIYGRTGAFKQKQAEFEKQFEKD